MALKVELGGMDGSNYIQAFFKNNKKFGGNINRGFKCYGDSFLKKMK